MRNSHVSAFERIRHETEDGAEYWNARELAKVLGYSTSYRNFLPVIEKAQTACENSGQAISDHYAQVRTMIAAGKGALREVDDFRLSRYACYLIVQNADPSKEIVALGQTYFAAQTRRAELADEAALAHTEEESLRLDTRERVKAHNKHLATAAKKAGVTTSLDFASFQNAGYGGLYGGLTASAIAQRKGLKSKKPRILDHMGSTELAANLFRITQTDDKLQRENVRGKARANSTHKEVGTIVRQAIKAIGGTMPEELPTPSESTPALVRKRKRIGAAKTAVLSSPKPHTKRAR